MSDEQYTVEEVQAMMDKLREQSSRIANGESPEAVLAEAKAESEAAENEVEESEVEEEPARLLQLDKADIYKVQWYHAEIDRLSALGRVKELELEALIKEIDPKRRMDDLSNKCKGYYRQMQTTNESRKQFLVDLQVKLGIEDINEWSFDNETGNLVRN